jgi:HSP20 family protein
MSGRNLLPWNWRGKRAVAPPNEDPLRPLHTEMHRLFEDLSRGLAPFEWSIGNGSFAPDVDVEERDDEILVSVELPGVDEKDVDLLLRDDVLTVRGEKREERSGRRRGGGRWTECRYGSFERDIPLPCEIDAERAQAEFRKGVLEVRLPKSAQARSGRRIEVRAG